MKTVSLIVLLMSVVFLVGGTLPQAKSENLLGTIQQRGPAARLISVEPLPETDGVMCEWVPAGATASLTNESLFQLAALQQDARPGQAQARGGSLGIPGGDTSERPPLRVIHDSHAAFSSVSVDPVRNEVAVSDENMFAIMVYDRTANITDPNGITKPKRVIQGRKTNIQFTCGVYMDPTTGEIYALNNDTQDKMVVFGPDQEGDVAPARMLQPPHAAFGIATNEETSEFYLTIQHSHSVVVYKKGAKGDDDPVRLLQGNSTGLANPHGIALDTKNKLMFVSNQGDFRTILPGVVRGGEGGEDGGGGAPQRPRQNWPMQRTANGSGRILPSSITVYPLDGQGDLAPMRVIKGPKTQLDWPIGMAVDPDRKELYVANDVGDSVLVFPIDADGDTPPLRKISGPRSRVKNPTGLFLDRKNDELWVSNFGSHSLTVFKPTASGDAVPLRTIQSAAANEPSLMIGNPGALAYDTKREELLVAN